MCVLTASPVQAAHDDRDARGHGARQQGGPARERRQGQTWAQRSAHAFVALLMLLPCPADAGYVSIDEPALDAIFAQPLTKWGWRPIDVQVAPSVRYADSSLATIDNDSELWRLFSLAPRGTKTIEVFFVDAINSCGGYAPNIIGCGLQPGDALVLNSSWAASRWGPALLAHELGHNLGLEHVPQGTPNLMNPYLTGNTDLDLGQVRALYSSPLMDWSQWPERAFFSILPIAIVASDWSSGSVAQAAGTTRAVNGVDEPALLALLMLAFGLFVVRHHRAPALRIADLAPRLQRTR